MPEPDAAVTPVAPPTFSVVIAAYNAASVVARAVRSALDQAPAPLEVIVCDDGSTDGTVEALAEFGDRVTVLSRAHAGEAAAKNAAVGAARGEYVAILDADDRYLPGRLAALGELAAARPDLDVLTTDAFLEVGGVTIRRCYDHTFPFAVTDQRTAILTRNFVFGMVAVRRARLLEIGGFDPEIAFTTDWDCWIRLVLGGSRIGLVDEPLAVYQLTPTSMSARRADMSRGRLATLTKARSRPDLSLPERHAVAAAIAREEEVLAREELWAAVEAGRVERRRALAVALGRHESARTRVRAAAVAVAPGAAHRWQRQRAGRRWTGVGGTVLPRG